MRKILFFILGISFFAADCAKKQSALAQRVLPDLTKFGGSYLVKVEYVDNVPQVTCTGKTNVKTLKLAYGGDKIWEDKSKTCKSAVVLFGLAAPQLAVLEINGENKKVYRYHDGKKWKNGNESKHKKKLEELKTEAKDHPITPQQTSKPATPAASQAPPSQQVSQQPTGAPAVQQEGAQAKPGDAPVVKGQGQAVPQTPQGQPQANAQPPVKPKEEPKATEPTNKSPAQQGSKEENKPESVPEVKQEQNPATNLQGGAKKEQDEAKEQQPAAKPVTLSERAKKVDAKSFDVRESSSNGVPLLTCTPKDKKKPTKLVYGDETIWSGNKSVLFLSALIYFKGDKPYVVTLSKKENGKDHTLFLHKDETGKWVNDKNKHAEKLKELQDAARPKESPEAVKDNVEEKVRSAPEQEVKLQQAQNIGSLPDPKSRQFKRHCKHKMHDDDDDPPTPSHDNFKVDESLFNVENGQEDGVPVLKLTAKDGTSTNKLTFDGKDVWKAQNDGDSCSVATFYLGPNNDLVAAKFTYKKADDKLGVGYRKHSSDGWEFIKSDAFQKLLQEVKLQQAQNIGSLPDPGSRTIHKKCTPRMHDDDDPPTPSHDSFKVDESLFNVEEGQENGLRTLKLTAKEGIKADKLTFGGFTVWEAQNDGESCSVATFYLGQNNNPVAAKFTYKKPDGKLGVGYRKHSNYKWEFIKGDEFQELLKETGETLGEFKDDCTPTKHDNPPTVEGSMPGPGSKEIKIDCTRKMHDDDNPPESGSIPDPGEIKRKCTPRQRDDNPPAVEGSMPDPGSRKFCRHCKHKMHDDDDPPVPSENFKVDESLFKAENGKDEGLNVIKLTAKDGVKPYNLTFDGKDVWECQNGTDLCSAATFYLGPDNNPVAAKFTYKKADNKLGVGYRKLSNGKWEYIKGDTFKNLLQETKEKPREFCNDCTKNMHGDNPQLAAMPGGPSEDPMEIQRRCSKRRKPTTEAELKKKYDSLATTSTLDIHGKVDNNTTVFNKNTSDGTILMAFSSKEGHYFNNVVQGSITVWTAENGEKCTSVNHRRTKPEEIIRVFVRTPTAFKRLYYRSGDNKWTKIQRHEYFNRLKLAQNTSSSDHKPAPKHDDLDDVIHDEEADEEEEEKEQEEYADV